MYYYYYHCYYNYYIICVTSREADDSDIYHIYSYILLAERRTQNKNDVLSVYYLLACREKTRVLLRT